MAKIVYNACFGGFGLSKAAAKFMAERGHQKARKELNEWKRRNDAIKYFHKNGKWPEGIDESEAKFLEIDAKYRETAMWYGHFSDLSRTDALLISAVETLGDAANGECAALRIAEISDGARYRIDEYDGNERVMTPDDYEWSVA